ncbi:MAG: hypothetical protein J6Y13_11405 [Treponema sp.]|nr:hypothetical protein [Treponema sp.]
MTGEEKYRILDRIKLENGFFLIDEQDCREENAALIENMEHIFDLRDGRDYTFLFAVAELLADKDKAQAVKDYLLAENSYKREDVVPPEWEDRLLVSTAMEDNPLFFSMAWNWTSLVEHRLGSQSQSDVTAMEESGDDWIGLLAASSGNTQFGEKTAAGLGTLFIDYREKYGEFFVGLKINENMLGKRITVDQRILLRDSGRELTAVIRTDNMTEIVYSQPFSVEEFGNPAKGFKYLGEPEIVSED